jgi:PAS domain-containing protein
VNVRLRAFPVGDRDFLDFAQAALAVLPEPRTPAILQGALRVRYPTAVVTVDDTPQGEGAAPDAAAAPVWHAFRTGALDPAEPAEPPARVGAWAVLDDGRRFVEVSPGLARIAELPARHMLGHRIEDFSNPADPTVREDIAKLWEEFRGRGSLASTLRFNYADGRPRELVYRLVADADGPGRHRLTVSVRNPNG